MYEIKPIFDRSEIQVDLPSCMYKMKNINDFNLKDSQSSNAQLTNGCNGAVSQLSTKSLPDIKQQIEKFLKVFVIPNHIDMTKNTTQFKKIHFKINLSQNPVALHN